MASFELILHQSGGSGLSSAPFLELRRLSAFLTCTTIPSCTISSWQMERVQQKNKEPEPIFLPPPKETGTPPLAKIMKSNVGTWGKGGTIVSPEAVGTWGRGDTIVSPEARVSSAALNLAKFPTLATVSESLGYVLLETDLDVLFYNIAEKKKEGVLKY